jgi:beta-lactamase class A
MQTLQAVEIRIQIEETAREKWGEAIRQANQALELQQSSSSSTETLQQIYTTWQSAIDALREVPDQSLMTKAAQEKLNAYETNLELAAYNYDTARSGFLEAIAERTGLPIEDVHITVCHIDGECRRLNGNVPLASPASLIKVPIAVALMEKVTSAGINLDTKILVNRGNYTEDASDIWVGVEYSLRKLVMRMINQSSNIATNQFIDYLGRDYINQVMRDRGYNVTFVDYKVVGENTYPANAGSIPNRSTTNELTEMMRQIYRQEHRGDDVLIDALTTQYDTVLAHDGLKGTNATWMGEKTGQNSKVLGTTYAFKIAQEMYIATIALDYSGNERAIRQCVKDIAKHIMENRGL